MRNKCQKLCIAVINDDKEEMQKLALQWWVSPDDPDYDETVYFEEADDAGA